jgi:alkanesulfonate monooxygenase SsuD/methylene tetrahydromethanopterin reductase-like flavin-dependent oxidoreductase (luciferase family)
LIDNNYEAAHARASKMLGTFYNADFSEASKKYCLLGRVEDCLEQMQRFVDAGARQFVLSPLMDSDAMIEVAEREILPELANMKLCA